MEKKSSKKNLHLDGKTVARQQVPHGEQSKRSCCHAWDITLAPCV